MKKENQILIGLGVLAVLIYAFRDKIFNPKVVQPSAPAPAKMQPNTLVNTTTNNTALDAAIKAKYGANYTPKEYDDVIVNGTIYKYAPQKCGFQPPPNVMMAAMWGWYDWSCRPEGALR